MPFRRLILASGLSNLADGIAKVALPLLAIHYTRSPAVVAGVELVRSLPWLGGSLPVGALVDRLDRRRTMVLANVARAAFVGAAALAVAAGHGSLALLYLAAAGTGLAEVFYDTAAQSILPAVVERGQLDRANSRLASVELGAQELAAPPLAGLLVAASLALAFTASAALWAAAVLALVAVTGTFRTARSGPATTLAADIKEGLAFLSHHRVLRTMAVMVGLLNFTSAAAFAVLVLYAVGPSSALGLTEPQFGLLCATVAAGGLLGGLLAERVLRVLGRVRTLTACVLAMIGFVAAPALTTSVPLLATAFLTGGAGLVLWNVTTVSFRQRVTPDHLLGRLNSAYRLLAWGTRPLGVAAGGALGQWLGVRSVFAVMGVLAATALVPNRWLTDEALAGAEAGATIGAWPPGEGT